ncbi:AraC family transcriptional regulator [Acinetobacter bereziniae]|uniref:AraC family transcriptional regulator n=1 Tax=Acinetobacter bereziniae TaxID=106648 RepID=UPI003212846D
MKQISIHSIEHLEHKIIAIETQYAEFYRLAQHSHQRAQLLYGAEGVMHVETPQGNWIIPPERAVWIPPEVPHQLTLFNVKTCSIYIRPEYLPRPSTQCEVLAISPLLRQLLLKAPKLNPPFCKRDELIFDLILSELELSEVIDLHLALPENPTMLKICRAFIQRPNIHFSPEDFAAQLCVSERHFSRLFKTETGMSFSKWRQHACVLLSLERLIRQHSIQQIAYDFGFKNPAAFSTMFHRVLGMSPSRYIQRNDFAN